ncbi:saccharopine dehydrogenase NADP-binding domain-containing protein [Streptomyces sp. NPDC049687]|uniref:saccharopine dehydrogenase NADP-binding domain-containing protein n=1 Tax=Streptomyces sp. NPDC049687 TaxID=3365596 RepID=UPI00379ED67E
MTVLLLGATGYTGQRVLRELLARGEKPTLVGRSRTRMLSLADRFEADLPVAEVDVTSTADLTRLLEPSDVVVSTIGPFMRLGMAAVTAAARVGAHYFDSTGEGTFARRVLLELDAAAALRGATLVPAFGYDYVPGNLAGALALTRAGERARHVEAGYFITRAGQGDELRLAVVGTPSRGVRAEAVRDGILPATLPPLEDSPGQATKYCWSTSRLASCLGGQVLSGAADASRAAGGSGAC